jgi:hypothetical protein
MMKGVKIEYVSIMSRHGLRMIEEDGALRPLISMAKRNVRVRLISEIDEQNNHIAEYLSRHIEFRRGDQIQLYLAICDKREMIFGPAITVLERNNSYERLSDLWTNNRQFIEGMHALFEYVWNKSQPYENENQRDSNQPPRLLT